MCSIISSKAAADRAAELTAIGGASITRAVLEPLDEDAVRARQRS